MEYTLYYKCGLHISLFICWRRTNLCYCNGSYHSETNSLLITTSVAFIFLCLFLEGGPICVIVMGAITVGQTHYLLQQVWRHISLFISWRRTHLCYCNGSYHSGANSLLITTSEASYFFVHYLKVELLRWDYHSGINSVYYNKWDHHTSLCITSRGAICVTASGKHNETNSLLFITSSDVIMCLCVYLKET